MGTEVFENDRFFFLKLIISNTSTETSYLLMGMKSDTVIGEMF